MKIELTDLAKEEFKALDGSVRLLFVKHFRKLALTPKGRHLQHGINAYTEEVTKQARIIYNFDNDTLYILRCCAIHKEYEKAIEKYKTT